MIDLRLNLFSNMELALFPKQAAEFCNLTLTVCCDFGIGMTAEDRQAKQPEDRLPEDRTAFFLYDS